MSEALSDVMSNLRDHASALPSAKEARDAVRDHLPSLKEVDTSVITDRMPTKRSKLTVIALALGAVAAVAAVIGLRRRSDDDSTVSPQIYTPPLPKP